MVFHSVIHRQVLCGKYSNLLCFIESTVWTVNFISSHGPNHLLFCKFLSEIEAGYSDLSYQAAVQWLHSGKFSLWYFKPRVYTEILLEGKNCPHHCYQVLYSTELTFAADLIMVCNKFSLKLKGKIGLKCKTYTLIKLFWWQRTLFESQVMSNYFIHFMLCQKLRSRILSSSRVCQTQTTSPGVYFKAQCECKGNFYIFKFI